MKFREATLLLRKSGMWDFTALTPNLFQHDSVPFRNEINPQNQPPAGLDSPDVIVAFATIASRSILKLLGGTGEVVSGACVSMRSDL
jgi:hypothetical protein